MTRQDVLRVADSVPALQNGSVCVHVRIEDVSKNHQNQRFRIAVLPDAVKAPADGDISPAVSNPVLVRSKRNKRNRKFAHLRSLGSQPTAPAPAPAIDTPRDPVTVYTVRVAPLCARARPEGRLVRSPWRVFSLPTDPAHRTRGPTARLVRARNPLPPLHRVADHRVRALVCATAGDGVRAAPCGRRQGTPCCGVPFPSPLTPRPWHAGQCVRRVTPWIPPARPATK